MKKLFLSLFPLLFVAGCSDPFNDVQQVHVVDAEVSQGTQEINKLCAEGWGVESGSLDYYNFPIKEERNPFTGAIVKGTYQRRVKAILKYEGK